MPIYKITFSSRESELPMVVLDMEAATLTTAINKSVREIEKVRATFRNNGYSDSHLCGLVVTKTEKIQ